MNTVFAMIRSNTIIPKSMQDYHLGCFRFGDPSTPVPCFREQTRPGFLALWIRLIIISFVPQINEKADRSTNQALKSSRIQQSRIKGAKNSFL